MVNPREIAMKILCDIEYNGAYSNIAVKKTLSAQNTLSARDKALITQLVYGVVSQKLNLDYTISTLSSIRLKKISKYILIILRLGIYQIKFTDKIPNSAAVNESVRLAKKYGHGASAAFVNGVLRSAAREEVKYPAEGTERISVRYSFPEWLCKKWIDDYGEEFALELIKAMNQSPAVTARVNTLKTDTAALAERLENAVPSDIYKNAVQLSRTDIGACREYRDGLFTVQDISAMLASEVLAPKPGERVLDMCAAPGGKATHLAEIMKNSGSITAMDIYPHKIDMIDKNAERLGIDIISSVCRDALVFEERFADGFDRILVDAPCSGLGIIRKKPDIKWNSTEENDICEIQRKILTNAAKYVKIGGEIVYSTCTLNRAENEAMLAELLEKNKNFEAVDFFEALPPRLRKETARKGYVTFFPHTDGTDGFFISKVRRRA